MPKLQIKILEDKQSLGRTTAEHAARSLRVAIRDRGLARIIAATGASQFEFLEALTRAPAEHSAPAEKRRKCPHTIHPSVLDRVSEKVNTLFVAYFTSRVLRFCRCRFCG
jgi:hypothetical protein